jgi:galactokinase
VDLSDLSPNPAETGTATALVRGVAARLLEHGCYLVGFDAFILSDVLVGSGLSSSASFEVLIGTIINHFFCGGSLTPVSIAKIGKYAENTYFGKPCGLMDQMACALGGASAIDFENPAQPTVIPVQYDFSTCGHALCIVDTGSGHDDLTADFADITREMEAVSAFFGKNHLREVSEADFRASLPTVRSVCGDRAVLRALHFFREDQRAVAQAEALNAGNFPLFLALMNQSGLSSSLLLQNTWSPAHPRRQALPLALAVGRELLGETGAIRVHGGGFAGTIQAFVPFDRLDAFCAGMDGLFGEGSCHVLRIRPQGACVIAG